MPGKRLCYEGQTQTGGGPLRTVIFLGPQHGIYISPSTFEYADEFDNLLWHDPADRELLAAFKPFKRESRLARDNSEDALTWNVFRYLEKSGRLGRVSWLSDRGASR